MQYTGLLDKNGKEIYEGDIVIPTIFIQEVGKANYEPQKPAKIYWNKDYLQVLIDGYLDPIPSTRLSSYFGSVEVIGNLWENPELIK